MSAKALSCPRCFRILAAEKSVVQQRRRRQNERSTLVEGEAFAALHVSDSSLIDEQASW